jgi:amino acid permease
MKDPVFRMQFRYLLGLIAVLELGLAVVCVTRKLQQLALALTAWMSANFVLYRFAMAMMHWQRPCPCLGYLPQALHLAPWMADLTLKVLMAYLFIGSYALLFRRWRLRRAQVATDAAS